MFLALTRRAAVAAVLVAATVGCLNAQPGRKSQLASVSQVVSAARIEIVYRRPVARRRALFGALVPYRRIWTPSADSAAVFTTSADINVAGQKLKAGQYALWMIPDTANWTEVFTSQPHVFHLMRPDSSIEVLRVRVKPTSGDHMESLGFYFPMVDADSATLVMHWGNTVVPIPIKTR